MEQQAELQVAHETLRAVIERVSELKETDCLVPEILSILARSFTPGCCGYYENGEDGRVYLRFWHEHSVVQSAQDWIKNDPSKALELGFLAEGFELPEDYLGVPPDQLVQPVVIDHERGTSRPDWDEIALKVNRTQELVVPLLSNGRSRGSFILYRGKGQPFRASDISLAQTLAQQLTLATIASELATSSRLRAVQAERQRMLGEIHDNVAQLLLLIVLKLRDLGQSLHHPGVGESLALAERALQELRQQVSASAQPTLTQELQDLAECLPSPWSAQLSISGDPSRISERSSRVLLRVAQEAIQNALRHSSGQRLMLGLGVTAREAEFSCSDDGPVNEPFSPGFGLNNMRRRLEEAGGTLGIDSGPNGFRIQARIPL